MHGHMQQQFGKGFTIGEVMMNMKNEDLENCLVEGQKYPLNTAKGAVKKILNARYDIRLAIENFLQTGELAQIQVNEYTVETLINSLKLNPVGAYLMLDWMTRDPEEAKRLLEKGLDRPEFKSNKM